ncbi:hypothetical protein EDD11_010469 [Mortierella claussenii]|nr:hypothetical protein EDD11_010469 [Mortierella claussenii]
MSKRESEKATVLTGGALDDGTATVATASGRNAAMAGISAEPSSFYAPVSDAASQFSKETTSDRKKKGWTKTLKRATSSIIYMAMPPTSVDNVPMIVAQTPMSPDRLIPTLHSPILQSPHLTAVASAVTVSPTNPPETTAAITTTSLPQPLPRAAESSASVVSSSSFSKPRSSTQDTVKSYPGLNNSIHSSTSHLKRRSSSNASSSSSSTVRKPSWKGKERAEPTPEYVNSRDHGVDRWSTSLASPPSSPPSRTSSRHANGASLVTAAGLSSAFGTMMPPSENQETLPSPPPSPMNNVQEHRQDDTSNHPAKTTIAEAVDGTDARPITAPSNGAVQHTELNERLEGANETKTELLPAIPPNLSRLSFSLDIDPEQTITAVASVKSTAGSKSANLKEGSTIHSAAFVAETRQDIVLEGLDELDGEADQQQDVFEEALELIEETAGIPVLPPLFSLDLHEDSLRLVEERILTSLPGSFPVEATVVLPESLRSTTSVELLEPILVESLAVESAAVALPEMPIAAPVNVEVETSAEAQLISQAEAKYEEPSVEARGTQSIEQSTKPAVSHSSVTLSEPVLRQPKIEVVRQITPSERKPPKAFSMDTLGFPMVPARSMTLSRSASKSSAKQQTAKNAPWLWHQDGFHQQRLESHQILTKEQVFEQFHLDLEQEGPNGFFLFKLVKRFKKQDPSLLAISSTLLDAELSASPISSPSSATPTSILESMEAISVSQRLKRQLLLQKRKKQRKSSNSDEEDENLEALLAMTNNNSSLQNLNSSLQEVIDAVDGLTNTEEWASLLNQSRRQSVSPPPPPKSAYPDSEGEYTSREKDAMDIETLEKRRGVYATGRLDGMNLMSKKRYNVSQRRTCMNASTRKGSIGAPGTPGVNGAQNASTAERRGSETLDGSSQQFKKHAVSQLHIYSRNGLKFKFDVMEDNELHFVEASKKYTFMDPLAAHRQPDLDVNGNDGISPLRSPTFPMPPNSRRTSSATVSTVTTATDASRLPRRSGSSRSKSTLSSSGSTGGRRVFVTRLGRHTLLTYAEYKVLAKSASSFTLGARLLIQRSLSVATPSFYGSSGNHGHSKDTNQLSTAYDASSAVSPTKATFGSSVKSTPTPTANADGIDYFSLKKKPRAITGFASKAVAAIKSPSSITAAQPKTPRPIVTPYNPNDYKTKSLTVSMNPSTAIGSGTAAAAAAATEEYLSLKNGVTSPHYTPAAAIDIPRSESPSSFPIPPSHMSPRSEGLPSSPPTPISMTMTMTAPQAMSTSPPLSTPSGSSSTSSSANPYGSIKRSGNQAGLKFQQLFVTVHQRLQKLELDNGASFYGTPLVQWTVIEDPAELRWWRDKIGIQMIGRLEGDEVSPSLSVRSGVSGAVTAGGGSSSLKKVSMLPQFSSTISLRSSYVSADSAISDATSTTVSSSPNSALSTSTSTQGYKNQVSVERLGYRFLRVSGHTGTLKVTVSEQVEARAVALAVRAEMLRQKRMAQQQRHQQQSDSGLSDLNVDNEILEQAWVEVTDSPVVSDDDEFVSSEDDIVVNYDDDSDIDGGKKKPVQRKKKNVLSSSFYDAYEYDEWTGRTRLRKEDAAVDRFSRRKRHDRAAREQKNENESKNGCTTDATGATGAAVPGPLIERMTMIMGQAKAFKGDWYMKNVYKFHP